MTRAGRTPRLDPAAEQRTVEAPHGMTRLTTLDLLFAATITIMAGATISPSLPAMAAHFGPGSELGVRLLLTITALAIAFAAPLAGWLSDRAGRVRVLWASVALHVAAGGAGLVPLHDVMAPSAPQAAAPHSRPTAEIVRCEPPQPKPQETI